MKTNSNCRSHILSPDSVASAKQSILNHLDSLKSTSDPATIERLIGTLSELEEFEFGQFLMVHRGLNGRWTDHVVKYPEQPETYTFKNKTEEFLVRSSPSVRATQERYQIFKRLIQDQLKNNYSILSAPCGLMSDILSLDFSHLKNLSITGIDIDQNSLDLAKSLAKSDHKNAKVRLINKDIFEIDKSEKFNLIVSNGFNIYLKDHDEKIRFYKILFDSMHPGGELITSFLTYPPSYPECHWSMDLIDPVALVSQKELFTDLLTTKRQHFSSEEETINQLKEAGFDHIRFTYDKARIFPTVQATRN